MPRRQRSRCKWATGWATDLTDQVYRDLLGAKPGAGPSPRQHARRMRPMAAICFSISVRAGASLNGRVRPPPRIARSWKSYRIVVKSTCTTSSSLINSEVSGNHWCRSRPTAASKLAPDVQPASGNAPNQARVSQASYASSALRIAAEAASRESCVGTGNPSPDFGEASRSKRGQEAPKSVRDSASSLRARNPYRARLLQSTDKSMLRGAD
jgi:hypothetical protein